MLPANAMSAAPTLSVILTCHNPGPRLTATLASIWEQRTVQPEVIVVDRNSTDGSRAWLASATRPLASVVQLPDGANVPEAFTQGLGFAHGEWVLLLEAGDRVVGDTVLSEALNWAKKTEAGVVSGEAAYDDGRLVKLRSNVNPIAGNFIARPAAFYRRALFLENEPFDPALDRLADYELNVRLWKSRVRFKPIPLRIAASDARASFSWRECRNEIRVRHRYFAAWRCWSWDALSLLRCLRFAGKRR